MKNVSAVEVNVEILFSIFGPKFFDHVQCRFLIPTKDINDKEHPHRDLLLDEKLGTKHWRIVEYIIGV